MPPRTNPFQKLILLIESQLAGPDTRVTESAMAPSQAKVEQETDILIETRVHGRRIVIAIECRDHKRPCTVTWINEMNTKYTGKANQVIAVSKSGFTRGALKTAAHFGIETLTLTEACSDDWKARVNRVKFSLGVLHLHNLSASLSLPEFRRIAPDLLGDAGEQVIYKKDGARYGTAMELFKRFIEGPQATEWMKMQEGNEDPKFSVRLRLSDGAYIIDKGGQRQKVTSVVLKAEEVSIRAETHQMTPAGYGANEVAHLATKWGGGDVVIAATPINDGLKFSGHGTLGDGEFLMQPYSPDGEISPPT